MVHVPAALPVRVPGRRGRPPKNRDQPIVPVPAPDGTHQKPVFITSLAFKVHGTNAIRKSPSPPPSPNKPPQTPAQPAAASSATAANPSPLYEVIRGRAPRKSKMDAMAAITARSVSPSDLVRPAAASTASGSRSNGASSSTSVKPLKPVVPELPSLDFTGIKMPQRAVDPPRVTPRPFGIEDCPAFYPTAEEFKDPMQYIKSISDKAKPYGICKVIPPEGWNMPFVTDTKTFSFKTRLQRLNSIEASSRAKLNFLEQLYRFHQQQDQVGPVVPTINHKPLDLWLLRKEVHGKDGFEAVSRTKQWGEIARLMGYDGLVGVSTQLKNAYTRIILPFEAFSQHIRNSESMAALSPAINFNVHAGPSPARMGGRMSSRMGGATAAPSRMARSRVSATSKPTSQTRRSTPMSVSSSALSEPPEDAEMRPSVQTAIKIEVSAPSEDADRSTSGASKSPLGPYTPLPQMAATREKPSNYVQGDTCEVCHGGDRGTEMLLCDGCDRGFHTFCLDPPLANIPKEQWFCHICLFDTGGDYGFDEGEEHSLQSFQTRDHAFRKAWFEAHPPAPLPEGQAVDPVPRRYTIGNVTLSEDDVEREFWRLVESPLETVEIEYGADVHSTTHGSASPSLETHPLDPYSKDGWNVNNMPIVSDSLLRYVKSDISGMTVPWIYVGMVFSTFCWHNEDHYTYSVNYMHWGETKTWYGVPGDDAEKFEAAIRSEAPDLFDAQPDLLFQLVTLMSPKRLKDAGVRVFGCNQRPGEYVITFPKAYHAGFNHGLNLNEAVNFAIPEWLNDGRDCVRRYQEHQKLPVFSHEELLITITQHSSTIKTAVWVLDSLKEMIENHLELRDTMRQAVPRLTESLEEHDVPEDQYQCAVCKGFSYLAQVTCDCTKQVACLEHWSNLCSCPHSQRVLRKRFDDAQLVTILSRVEERAKAPETWRKRLVEVLTSSPTPDLGSLRTLLTDAEDMSVPMPEYPNLKKFVETADGVAEEVIKIVRARMPPTFRKHIPRRKGTSADVPIFQGEYTVADIRRVLEDAKGASFSSDELDTLSGLEEWMEDWKARATRMLGEAAQATPQSNLELAVWDALLREGYSHDVRLPLLEEVGQVVKRCRLIEELRGIEGTALTFDDVQELQRQAKICGLRSDHDSAKKLQNLVNQGEAWAKVARAVLEKPIRSLDELDNLVSPPQSVPVIPNLLDRIDIIRAEARRKERAAKLILSPLPNRRTSIDDALKFIVSAKKEFNIPAVHVLETLVSQGALYEKNCADILLSRYSPQKPLFEELREMRSTVQGKLWFLYLPNFEKVDGQLVRHDAWLEKLPWYRTPEPAMQGKLIVDDVLTSTRPDDNQPPSDPECTCICQLPVRVTVERQSDAVQCDHCGAKFHSKCIEGSCPFCDHHHWNGAMSKSRNFQYTDLLPIAREAPDLTRNYSLAWKHLDIIITYVDKLMRAMDAFLAVVSEPSGPMPLASAVSQIRHFLRKLYKIQFSIKPRADLPGYGLTLCHLHRTLATTRGQVDTAPKKKTNRRPKFVFSSEMVPPATDATQCLCKGARAGSRMVTCSCCSLRYHGSCVRYEDLQNPSAKPWRCPLCMVRKGKQYPHAVVRVRALGDTEPTMFVDTKTSLENYSSQMIRHQLPPAPEDAIILTAERFLPGSNQYVPPGTPASSSANGSSAAGPSQPTRQPPLPANAKVPTHDPSKPPAYFTNNNAPALSNEFSLPLPNVGKKRKSPNSPVTENPRRVKLLLRDEEKPGVGETS